MRHPPALALALFFALLVALLAAQTAPPAGASTPNTGPRPWDPDESALPTAVTDHLKCVITEVKDDRVIRIWDEKTREENLVRIAEKVEIRARKKSQFEGRSELDFRDLLVGHRIKLTYLTEDGTIVGVKVVGRVDKLPGTSIRLAGVPR